MYYGIPVISTVVSASGGTCVELSATRSKVPHHSNTGGDHLLNLWGPHLESLLRLVLGDEHVSGALVIHIVTHQTQYSCYLVFPLYARSCWRLTHGV